MSFWKIKTYSLFVMYKDTYIHQIKLLINYVVQMYTFLSFSCLLALFGEVYKFFHCLLIY